MCRNMQLWLCKAGWSGKRDSNPQPSAWEADALPLRHSRVPIIITTSVTFCQSTVAARVLQHLDALITLTGLVSSL